MKKLAIITLVMLLAACTPKGTNEPPAQEVAYQKAAPVTVVYLHGKQRCATCLAIGRRASKLVDSLYADQVAAGRLALSEVDFSTEDGARIAEHYQLANSSLVLDTPDSVINLTTMAFNYARLDPDEFNRQLKAEIDRALSIP